MLATLKGDKFVDVIPDYHFGKVFLLLSHINVDDDLLAHWEIFYDLSLEPSKQMRPQRDLQDFEKVFFLLKVLI